MVSDSDDSASLEGERKTVTAVFADIKGSMDLIEDLDPEEARAMLDPALTLMMEAVQRYGGYVAQSTGDGIFALFGAPVAHEDHPQRALYAAVRMQEDLKRYSDRIRTEGRLPIQTRVGVNTGEVVVRSITTGEGRTEYVPVGHSTGIAARMQSLAPVGSIAATETVRKLCEGYFLFRSLGPTRVKGVSEPVDVYEVTGRGPLRTRLQRSAARGYTKFVGRQREMETMEHAAELTKAGHGQLVAAVAEPGVGKSRLFFEFKAKNQSGWMVLEAFSAPHGKASAYLPVLELLQTYFKITSDDDARARREKLARRITVLDRALEDALPYLFALLGIVEGEDPLAQIDANVRKRRTLDAIKRILLRESLNQPLILMFEDLHWIDDSTQEFLNLLADSIANAKILLLINYRPEYTHQWGSKTYYAQLRLDPLGKEAADKMLGALLGDAPEMVPLKKLIIERTERNPFFMEETVQVLFEEGALVRNGTMHLTKPIGELNIPPTVQAILAARIDRLPADAKDLLQTLSVIGRQFPMSLVRAVVPKSDDELERMLNGLQLGEFIYEQPAVRDAEYIFKHARTQEVAYNSVLLTRRKALHERVARSIEEVFADRLDDTFAQLANHYVRAGNTTKAVFYLDSAAQRAMSGSAFGEAVALLKSGLELIKHMPEDRARDRLENSLCLNLYHAAKVVQVHGLASEELLNRARYLSEKLADDAGLFNALELLADRHGNRLDASGTRSVRDQLIRVASRIKDPSLLARVRVGLGRTFLLEGHFKDAAGQFKLVPKHENDGLATVDRSILEWMSHCYGISAWNTWLLGYPFAALIESDKSVAISAALGSPLVSARALGGRSALHLFMQNPEAALQDAKAALEVCHREELSGALQRSGLYHSWALIQRGDAQLGTSALLGGRTPISGMAAQIRERAAREGTWGGSTLTRFFTCLAEGCLRAGYIGPGLEVVDESLGVVHASGVSLYEAETLRFKGELLMAKDATNTAPSEECYRNAIEVAHVQEARSWELRATMSLARLLRNTGRREEARSMLAEIFSWFTEGFDTADLKDAKALLGEFNERQYSSGSN